MKKYHSIPYNLVKINNSLNLEFKKMPSSSQSPPSEYTLTEVQLSDA
jgi:hypothetical protein